MTYRQEGSTILIVSRFWEPAKQEDFLFRAETRAPGRAGLRRTGVWPGSEGHGRRTFGSTFAEALDMGTHVEERLHRKRKTEHAGNGTGNQKIGPPEASQAKRPPSHLDWSAERAPRAS